MASAQTGGHEHVAEEVPIGTNLVGRKSPLLNQQDVQWNFGEALLTPWSEAGGVLGEDLSPKQAIDHVKTLRDWQLLDDPITGLPGKQHYIGELRPDALSGANIDPNEKSEESASFEIVVADDFPRFKGTGSKTVVVLSVRSTSSSWSTAAQVFDPHVYPGNKDFFGLWTTDPRLPELPVIARSWPPATEVVEHFRQHPTADFNIVGAWIVPRVAGRPLNFAVQRTRQLRHVVLDQLKKEFGTDFDENQVAFVVAGGSFGGFVTQVMLQLWPEEFHAGVAVAWSGNLRGLLNYQDGLNFLGSSLGRAPSGAGYQANDGVDWSIFGRNYGTDYQSLSVINRLRWGDLRRPLYLVNGDEDTVSSGDLWLRAINPNVTEVPYPRNGFFHLPNQPSPEVGVWWGVFGKGCHSPDVIHGEPYFVGADSQNPNSESHDPTDAVFFMIEQAPAQLDVGVTNPVRMRTKEGSLATLNPFDHVLDRLPFDADAGPPPVPADAAEPWLLQEAPGFARHGHGTWLGIADSLVVTKHEESAPQASVYVGSADGVVTRFELEPHQVPDPLQPTQNKWIFPLVEQCRTKKNGKDYSLGHGTWGLAVGDLDGSVGKEVVVCAYRRIAVFDAEDLELIAVRGQFDDPMNPDPDLEWLYTQPLRVQIGEINSANPGKEIVFTTQHGKLVVLDKDLNTLAEHGESGIVDLLVGPSAPMRLNNETTFTKPIYALSARGHVVSLELDSTQSGGDPANMGFLSAVSPLQYGKMWDLEKVAWPAGGGGSTVAVAALFSQHPTVAQSPTSNKSIRIFDNTTLNLLAEFGSVDVPVPPMTEDSSPQPLPAGEVTSFAVAAVGEEGQQYFVVLHGEHLLVWDDSGVDNYLGMKHLPTFVPAKQATSIAAGDIDPEIPGDEIVVSTVSGRVVWFSAPELLGTQLDLGIPRVIGVDSGDGQLYDDRTNTTLAATWGLALHPGGELHAIDQGGTWWKVDPETGAPELVRELESVSVATSVRRVSDLLYAGPTTVPLMVESQGIDEEHWQVINNAAQASQDLLTTPYLPRVKGTRDYWWIRPAPLRTAMLTDDFWVCPEGGALWLAGSDSYLATWAYDKAAEYGNLVQLVRFDPDQSPTRISSIMNSTKAAVPNSQPSPPAGQEFVHPPAPSFANPDFGIALRNESWGAVEAFEMQSIELGKLHPSFGSQPQVVVSTQGGRVVVLALSGAAGNQTLAIVDQSEDYGFGGMALALHDLDGDTFDEVIFAPAYSPSGSDSDYLRSRVHVLKHNGGGAMGATQFTDLTHQPPLFPGVPLGDPDPSSLPFEFPGFGACGIAVADLDGNPDGKLEIIVTTLNGEIVVFRWDNGQLVKLYNGKVEGSLGAFNSIVVADLSPANGTKPEVYVAGSYGIRRFDVQGAPPP